MAGEETFFVAPAEEIPPGAHKIVTAGGREVGIYNVDDTYYAVQNLCPHALAPICIAPLTNTTLPSKPGEPFVTGLEGRVLRCIWHAWEFDVVTGEALFGTDRRKLKTFPVWVEDGQIAVKLRPRRSDRQTSERELAPDEETEADVAV
jgi:nitrite reductase/ring-hydroxylating ferredoxin subunit